MTRKLIVSDVDGTLVPEECDEISRDVFDMIRAVTDRGILFALATGRPYHSLKEHFAEVADRVVFIVENGSAVFYRDEVLYTDPLSREMTLDLCRFILEQPGCEFLASGMRKSYIMPKERWYAQKIASIHGFCYDVISQLEELPDPVIKVAACRKEGVEAVREKFTRKWGDKVRVCVSGQRWIDFTVSEKGKALSAVCRNFGIEEKETVVFGDNWNDVSMLERGGRAYIMHTSHPELRARFSNVCGNVPHEVMRLLEKEDFLKKPLAFSFSL